jgi:hypothetical protein
MRIELVKTLPDFIARLRAAVAPGGPGLTGRVMLREALRRNLITDGPHTATWLIEATAFRPDAQLSLTIAIGQRWLPEPGKPDRDPLFRSNRQAAAKLRHGLERACWRLGVELAASMAISAGEIPQSIETGRYVFGPIIDPPAPRLSQPIGGAA